MRDIKEYFVDESDVQQPLQVYVNAHARMTLKEVLVLLKISRSQLYRELQKRRFPPPVRTGRSIRWILREVVEHLQMQEAAR